MDSVFGRLLYYFLNFGAVQDSILNHADNPKQSTEYKEFVHAKIYAAFDEFNNELQFYQHKTSALAWNISFDMSPEILDENQKFTINKNIWNNHWCTELLKVYHDPEFGHFYYPWDMEHLRQLYLICRGPRFSSYQLSNVLSVLSKLQRLYNKEVCIPSVQRCMRMEPDLNRFMETTRDEVQLRDAWEIWHKMIGTEVKPVYSALIRMLNQGAKQAGFTDMGQCWRNEMEIDGLKELVIKLYTDVKPLYVLLHSFVRHKLEKFYGLKFENGLIPAHLLGNMWAQKWDSLIDIMMLPEEKLDDMKEYYRSSPKTAPAFTLVEKILPKMRNSTVVDMVKAAENFFVSMGLPRLPTSFWENSYFQDASSNPKETSAHTANVKSNGNSRNCHGSAANMFDRHAKGDFRIMMCAQVNDEDLITIHHEVGHIMYFMAYSKLPTIFQDGANSAFHESVGDSITYDLMNSGIGSPNDFVKSILKTGLAKLPQIGYGLIMDLWRWKIFENPDKVTEWNDWWWQLNEEFLGITKPRPDYNVNGDGLDAAGKFHVIDNIPYIRYFLASFLQVQFYEAMCKASDERWDGNLHRCEIKGSKEAGELLWSMMKQGTTRPWFQILQGMTGSSEIKSKTLLTYFEPLRTWLEYEITRNNIPTSVWIK